jgi:AcrR family transcriptional regulator
MDYSRRQMTGETKRGAPGRVSRESWVLAALEALGKGGVDAVAVEPVAKQLGVTKGSFYWHFENRAQLLEAALDAWEEQSTTTVITLLDRMPDPATRLRFLFGRVSEAAIGPRSISTIHAALGASGDPLVARVLERVANARLAYVARCYVELGFAKEEADERAFLAYAAYLGMTRLVHDIPNHPSLSTNLATYTDFVIEALVPMTPTEKKKKKKKT